VFNLSGSEIIVILLLALVILGPEKLPEAMRKAGRAYSELRKMANSFQSEVRSALDEPLSELRGTADAIRDATSFTDKPKASGSPKPVATSPAPATNPPPAAPAADLTSDRDPDPGLDHPDVDDDLDLEPEVEPDPAAIADVLEGDDDDDEDAYDEGPEDDVITRTLSGDVGPRPPSDGAGPDS
jgi:sec-independent protein translocase protein TatB